MELTIFDLAAPPNPLIHGGRIKMERNLGTSIKTRPVCDPRSTPGWTG